MFLGSHIQHFCKHFHFVSLSSLKFRRQKKEDKVAKVMVGGRGRGVIGKKENEIFLMMSSLREGFTKKVAVLLDFVQMRGGGGPAQFFSHLFLNALLVYFLQNANNLNSKPFFRLYT